MHILLIGPPGSGKGTQAALISQYYKLPAISMGELCRSAAKRGTKTGKYVKKMIEAGKLIPDEMATDILVKRLKKKDCKDGFILDGYPRNMKQVRLFSPHFHIDYAIYLNVPTSVVLMRLTGRWQCRKCGMIYGMGIKPKKKGACNKCGGALYQRTDDKEAAIRARLKTFNTLTKPMINYYKRKGVLHTVNGDQGVEKIFESIKRILK